LPVSLGLLLLNCLGCQSCDSALLTLTLCACTAAAAATNAGLLAVPAKQSTAIVRRHPAFEILTGSTQAHNPIVHSLIHS